MKERISSCLKKRWLQIWAIVVSLALFNMLVAFADYPTSLPNMKRVAISTSVDRGTMFSSNICIENGTSYYSAQYKTALTTQQIANNDTYIVDVFFWNYSLKDIYSKYGDDIDYTLSFKLVDQRGEALSAADLAAAEPSEGATTEDIRTITITDQSNNSVELSKTCLDSSSFTDDDLDILSQTLVADDDDTSTNSLRLEFSNNWNLDNDTNICLQIIADVDQSKYPDLLDLGAIIGLKRVNDTKISGWYAYLNEHRDSTDTRASTVFDGYNIVLEGSGQAEITITFDASKFGINKNFYGTFNVTDTTIVIDEKTGEPVILNVETGEVQTQSTSRTVHFNEINSDNIASGILVISANSNDESNEYRNRYNIQLYKKGTDDAEDVTSSWNFFAVRRGTVTATASTPTNWIVDSNYNSNFDSAAVKISIKNIES